MVKKFLWIMVAACLTACPGLASAGETDVLVQKLVEKGVLTPYEAQIVLDETKQEVAKQNAKGTNDAIPTWIQTTKIKGDFRTRYEHRENKGSPSTRLSRERIRVRLGLESKINDQTKVGIGMATGRPGDPRSRNITLGSSGYEAANENTPASGKSILLDYAFAQYKPVDFATLTAGKFQNPLWQPNDMIWKGDITPEGLAANVSFSPFQGFDLFMNDMVFVMRNTETATVSSTNNDSINMAALQPGFNWAVSDSINLKGAASYYLFQNIEGSTVQAKSSGTNSKAVDGTSYKYGYDSVSPSLEMGVKNPFGETMGAYIPYAAVFGDYIYNVDSHHPNTGRGGFDSGVRIGYEKVSDKNQWQSKFVYSKLGRDAWLDAFTDSDRYQGKTNTRSYEAAIEYGIGKNSSIALDYYYSTLLSKTSLGRTPEQLIQVDWNLKF